MDNNDEVADNNNINKDNFRGYIMSYVLDD